MKPDKIVKKKGKLKRSRSKDSSLSFQVEDVLVHTALPPQVEGQLRCFCRVTVNQIIWTIPNSPDITHVRVKWWGEGGDGAIFRPVDPKVKEKVVSKTTARYPVRSGPKQFAAYLNDMGSLLVEVLSGKSKVAVGRSEIPQISLLSTSYPINGSFPVFSPSEEKIAELQLSLVLEPLMASYDSMGSIPTTDISVNSNQGMRTTAPKQLPPSPYPQPITNSIDDPFASPNTNKTESKADNESFGRVAEYSLSNQGRRIHPEHNGEAVFITTGGDVIRANSGATGHTNSTVTGYPNSGMAGYSNHGRTAYPESGSVLKSGGGERTGDLLSTLLNRGSKLREAMIVSSLNSEADVNDQPVIPTLPNNLPSAITKQGQRYVEIMADLEDKTSPSKSRLAGESDLSDIEGRAVDLILGHGITNKEYQHLKAFDRSPCSSISEDPDAGSELEDPLHDDTIIHQLFYKNPDTDDSCVSGISGDESIPHSKCNKSITSIEDPGNRRPPSRRSSVSSGAELAVLDKDTSITTPTVRKPRSRLKCKTKGVKKGKRSRSRSRTRSVSDLSDSDHLSTPRSETSRVSFDMTPSDIDDDPVTDKPPKSKTDGLSVERLTLLGRVHVARVTIESLNLTSADLNISQNSKTEKKTTKKPPKMSPKPQKPRTYFVEYQFPVVATSRDKHAPNAMATEVIRVASKNVKDNCVQFNHRSVFPIYFDGSSIEKWWTSALVFKVFNRTQTQKVPVQVGSCGVSLKSILKSDALCLTKNLEVRDGSKVKKKRSSVNCLGSLRVVVELASDSKDFSTALAKTKLAELQGNVKIMPIAPVPAPPSLPPMGLEATRKYKQKTAKGDDIVAQPLVSNPPPNHPVRVQDLMSCVNSPPPKQTLYPASGQAQASAFEPPTLYTMLLIPEGRNIRNQGVPPANNTSKHPAKPIQPTGAAGRNLVTRNTYLVCRMFWSDDVVSSNVTWGTSEPQYGFLQVSPVLVSVSLLERMRNNFMIVEVWDKKTSAENDKLVGIVKLSLHSFYMSFREQKIANSLLRSQFPVISVDGYVSIMDPFSGTQFGQLKVLLAMGSLEQVSYLQRLKGDSLSNVVDPQRPLHYLERQSLFEQNNTQINTATDASVEHQFEVVVEGIRNLQLFEEMIWGEADCFVQYYFPHQSSATPSKGNNSQGVPTLKSFRTATTLCLPDPTFQDVTRHSLLLSSGSPVQKQLLTACSNSGHGSGGLPFEVWCRYYHPNVRDQVVAKGTLPLAKLCAMVTMQKKGENTVQTFSLPLTSVLSPIGGLDTEKEAKVKDCGLMDVTVTYKTQLSVNKTGLTGKEEIGPQVCISLGVIRASGLKAAAEALCRHDSGLQYPAEVGVNSYVKVLFSFLTKEDARITRTVARNFAPEFSHHMDFPCPLLWTEADSDALSLAEILESGELTLEIWHQVPGLSTGIQEPQVELDTEDIKGRRLVTKTSDVLLGTCTIHLCSLLTHRTGISGWFPIHLPANQWNSNKDISQSEQSGVISQIVGGIELTIKFAHNDDRDRVIHAGRGVGWSPLDMDVEEEEVWESEEETAGKGYQITLSVDQATFPLQNAMIIGQTRLDEHAKCYIRYKFYDRASVVSKVHGLEHSEFEILKSKIKHKQQLQLQCGSPFKWYLREERLEIQVWVTYGHNIKETRPRHRDKLIGSAFISMETLIDQRRKQHKVSGIYPLFKPGAANLYGGYIRAYISLKPFIGSLEQVSYVDENSDGMEDEDYDPEDSFHQHTAPPIHHGNQVKGQEEVITPSFTAHISVERAMHLPWISEKHGNPSSAPNAYVSFQTSECSNPLSTCVVVSCDSPVWDFQVETPLSTQLLFQDNKNLVFKVWHKPDTASKTPDKSSDRVLGFVSVDLVPLTTCLQQLCGWYNIMDFNGQCQGQIKVSITPLEDLSQYRKGLPSSQQSVPAMSSQHSSVFYPPVLSQHSLFDHWSSHHLAETDQSLAHFKEHYQNVKLHHEMLQMQGTSTAPSINKQGKQPSVHWNPSFPSFREPTDSSKSFLFSALRKQLSELDEMNDKFKARLTNTEQQPSAPLDYPGIMANPGQFNHEHILLNSSLGESSAKTSARDSGNVTNHEISKELIGSSSLPPSARSVHQEDQNPGIPSLITNGAMPTIGGMNSLSSELEVSEDFLRTHVPVEIQELLQAARQINRTPGIDVSDNNACLKEDQVTENSSEDEENYFHRYQDFMEDKDTDEEGYEDSVVMPRALNDVSGKDYQSLDDIYPPPQSNIDPVSQSYVYSVPQSDIESPKHGIYNSPTRELLSDTNSDDRPSKSQSLQNEQETDSWLAEPLTIPNDQQKGTDTNGWLAESQTIPNDQQKGTDTNSWLAESQTIPNEFDRNPPPAVVDDDVVFDADSLQGDHENTDGPSQSPDEQHYEQDESEACAVFPVNYSQENMTNSAEKEQLVFHNCKPPSIPTTPRNEMRVHIKDDSIETDELDPLTSLQRETTQPNKKLPNFFPSSSQMAQSMKALELLSEKKSQMDDPDRLQEKALAAQQVVKSLTSANPNSKFPSRNKLKSLPSAEETKRIAKIFASKFS